MAESSPVQTAAADAAAPAAVQVQEAPLSEQSPTGPAKAGASIDIVLDSVVSISACLGEAVIPIRQLLQTGPGSVLILDQQVGQTMDLFLEGRRFATGHLVLAGDRLAIRIKEILSPPAAGKDETPA